MPKLPGAKPDLIVIAWYTPDGYERIRLLGHGDGLHATFAEWQKNALQQIASLSKHGVPIERHVVDPDDLAAWLRARNLKGNEQTRAWYVHEIASAKNSSHH